MHIPFCERKCDYCDFVSFVTDDATKERYFDALLAQIDEVKEFTGKVPVDSLFFGGGTPSAVDSKLIEKVVDKVFSSFDVDKNVEITIEANPNSASLQKLKDYKAMGINRVSFGVQSFDDTELKYLYRLHNSRDAVEAFENARKAGFDNINLDLMSAIPGQGKEAFIKNLKKAVELGPEHISAYSLIIEEGTNYYKRFEEGDTSVERLKALPNLPDEDTDRYIYEETRSFLEKYGYRRYEISNYSKEGYECKHNIGYWQRIPYLGFGISAASLWQEKRWTMHSDLKRFINRDFSHDTETLSDTDIMEEFMFLGLRLISGISREEFRQKFNKDIEEVYGDILNRLIDEKLLTEDGDRVFLSYKGLDLANYVMAQFML